MCVCVKHITIYVLSHTTRSSVLELAFWGLIAPLPRHDSSMLCRGARGEDAEHLRCFFLILVEIVLSSSCLLLKALFWSA